MNRFLHTQSPARIIAAGFALAILLGSVLLILPCSVQDGVDLQYIDALYTSTSAVCVTGLIAVDAGDTFTPLGQFFLAMLIQVGGLGVTAVGAGIIVAMGRKVDHEGPQPHPRGHEPGLRQGRDSLCQEHFRHDRDL